MGMQILRDAGPDAEQSERNRLEPLSLLIDWDVVKPEYEAL